MITKLLGLSLLLVGFGVIFHIWMKEIGGKAKQEHVDNQPLSSLPAAPEATAEPSSTQPARSEAPASPEVSERAIQAPELGVSSASAELKEDSVLAHPAQCADQVCLIAESHLSVADQLLQVGDIEGAIELAALVSESTSATPSQIALAAHINNLCT